MAGVKQVAQMKHLEDNGMGADQQAPNDKQQ